MGTIIDCARVAHASWRSRHSALRIAVATARACLDAAGCRPNDLDLLINAGIYRDRNLGEPALAALIQGDIGANPEDPHPGAHGTFSYDVANGLCGPLTALQIVDGFLRSGAINRALVVASDADPGHHLTEEPFPFANAGGALLCHCTDDDSGFGPFCWANSLDRSKSFRATVTYHNGRNRLRIEACDATDHLSAALAAKVAQECLDRASISVDAIGLVLAAPARASFADGLASHLGVPVERIAVARDDRIHTATLIAAFHDADAAGRLQPGTKVLFVAAGSGITAGAALYRVPDVHSEASS
jgi:3-oxoacyl-[acyl-carrier-protein] synthase III